MQQHSQVYRVQILHWRPSTTAIAFLRWGRLRLRVRVRLMFTSRITIIATPTTTTTRMQMQLPNTRQLYTEVGIRQFSHNLPGCDQSTETLLVRKRITRSYRTARPARRRRTQYILTLTGPNLLHALFQTHTIRQGGMYIDEIETPRQYRHYGDDDG